MKKWPQSETGSQTGAFTLIYGKPKKSEETLVLIMGKNHEKL